MSAVAPHDARGAATAERDHLAADCRRAGYSVTMLERIAAAALPGYVPGRQLDDARVRTVRAAVEVCAQSGASDEQLLVILDDYARRFGAPWRQRFWTSRLRAATVRFNDPERFGPRFRPDPEPAAPRPAALTLATTPAIPEPEPRAIAPTPTPPVALPPAAIGPPVDDEPPPTVTPDGEPRRASGAPDPTAPVAPGFVAPQIHPAVAAAPILRARAA
jgi:hypothetical protein